MMQKEVSREERELRFRLRERSLTLPSHHASLHGRTSTTFCSMGDDGGIKRHNIQLARAMYMLQQESLSRRRDELWSLVETSSECRFPIRLK